MGEALPDEAVSHLLRQELGAARGRPGQRSTTALPSTGVTRVWARRGESIEFLLHGEPSVFASGEGPCGLFLDFASAESCADPPCSAGSAGRRSSSSTRFVWAAISASKSRCLRSRGLAWVAVRERPLREGLMDA